MKVSNGSTTTKLVLILRKTFIDVLHPLATSSQYFYFCHPGLQQYTPAQFVCNWIFITFLQLKDAEGVVLMSLEQASTNCGSAADHFLLCSTDGSTVVFL